jgi:predicted metalloprotease with PDZ domain
MKIMEIQKNNVLKVSLMIGLILQTSYIEGYEKKATPVMHYSISMPEPENHLFHVELVCKIMDMDTIDFKIPGWMPGYYQMMNYSSGIKNFSVHSQRGSVIPFERSDSSTWRIVRRGNDPVRITYDVYSDKRFVAQNFLDTTHAYIVPAATFMYIDKRTNLTVNVTVTPYNSWNNITTGLEKSIGTGNEFTAPDFDILYDCPILIGNLDELPSFTVNGIVHRFIAYKPGTFDRNVFISSLEKTVRAGIDLIGDISYKEYTFIGIGPGYGGIEHLNNTTVSFNGNGLEKPGAMVRMLKFLGHEYFHNYNVKRIRPYELGPFDYDRENRTNLLWVSEGLSVYYEYLMVRRAGLMSNEELLSSLEGNINTIENDPGLKYQSLSQSSYETWDDGPFGNKPGVQDKSISYYEKGPVIAMILDFSIRNATENKKSLDDVMRFLYRKYYQNLHRGFTDAEFQQTCQAIAGISLTREFEYVYTTKDIDYSTYLSYAGLKISEEMDKNDGKRKFTLKRLENMNPLQLSLFQSWSGD